MCICVCACALVCACVCSCAAAWNWAVKVSISRQRQTKGLSQSSDYLNKVSISIKALCPSSLPARYPQSRVANDELRGGVDAARETDRPDQTNLCNRDCGEGWEEEVCV